MASIVFIWLQGWLWVQHACCFVRLLGRLRLGLKGASAPVHSSPAPHNPTHIVSNLPN